MGERPAPLAASRSLGGELPLLASEREAASGGKLQRHRHDRRGLGLAVADRHVGRGVDPVPGVVIAATVQNGIDDLQVAVGGLFQAEPERVIVAIAVDLGIDGAVAVGMRQQVGLEVVVAVVAVQPHYQVAVQFTGVVEVEQVGVVAAVQDHLDPRVEADIDAADRQVADPG